MSDTNRSFFTARAINSDNVVVKNDVYYESYRGVDVPLGLVNVSGNKEKDISRQNYKMERGFFNETPRKSARKQANRSLRRAAKLAIHDGLAGDLDAIDAPRKASIQRFPINAARQQLWNMLLQDD